MIGATLSHYEILEKLGAGGMGVVYRARDTKLGRDVAIKVLPEDIQHDAERLSRFEREARLLASLNHPHVATLYGFDEASGTRFLVMELVEGETLADRIARHPLPLEEALPLFRQIAEGLEAAHEKGIIHRDLKPSNVKLTPEGKVKVLDFGLAKTFASRESGSQSESPTVTRSPSESGVILGTAAYMSPEQARGKALDKRTDVWAFGCCLFEALTGRAAFLGETVSDTVAKILEREPAWGALPGRTPTRIRELLDSCLTKDPANRLRDIGDARIELARGLTERKEAPRPNQRALYAAIPIAVAAVSIAVALWSLTSTREPPALPVLRAVLPLPEGESLRDVSIAISPDGRHVAYATGDESSSRLYLKKADELEGRLVEGSEGADAPFFSLDGEWVGFAADGRTVLRSAVSGGAPLRVTSVRGSWVGLNWHGDSIIQGDILGGLSRIPAGGGEPEVLTLLHPERREKSHRFPQVLPGGDAVLFTIGTSTMESWDDASIAVASMKTGEYKVVLEGGFHARYSPTGHLLYARSGTLYAVSFDRKRLEVTGRPVPVVRGVTTLPNGGGAAFAVSENGSLVYAPGLSRTTDARVIWVDRAGRAEPLIETPRPLLNLTLSTDGLFLAFYIMSGNDSVWLYEIERETLTRWTSEWDHGNPLWAPNTREIAFGSLRPDGFHLYKQSVHGDGIAELLWKSYHWMAPTSWSPDGAVLLLDAFDAETGMDVWMLPISGDRKAEPVLDERANEERAAFSPGGEWIAYQSDETGQFEIYLRRFPSGRDKKLVSTGGGDHPKWNPNGKELFYWSGDKMMSVAIEAGADLILGRSAVLFQRRRNPVVPQFEVTPDGQRFIFIDDSVAEPAPTHLVLVQNFGEELKRLVPQTN